MILKNVKIGDLTLKDILEELITIGRESDTFDSAYKLLRNRLIFYLENIK